MDGEEGNESSVYVYNGVGRVPTGVTHVRVDPSVTIIPELAFESCRKLVKVELPEGLIRIEMRAFYNCQSLKRINLPLTLVDIAESAFSGCNDLEEITLPEGLRSLNKWAFCNCRSLKSINIAPGIERIEEGVFCYCASLIDTEIVFPEGLREIERDAFSRCTSLVSITLPSSLRDIGIESFEGCTRLTEVHMPTTIESIGKRAFKGCNFTNFRMPPPIVNDDVDISIVQNNLSLVSLELPETIEQIDDKYDTVEEQYTNLGVRNIALPSNEVDTGAALRRCKELGIAFPDVDADNEKDTTISDALKHRFDDLPIHKICYYQSYHDNETTIQSLKREINPWTTNPPGQLNLTGKQQDCLGMTPLHILACSTKPTIEMYQLLIEKYPETLIMKDKWGDIPLIYALWCNVPSEVIDLLIWSYKTLHPDFVFDWKGMLLTLSKRDAPLANIQMLINTQQQISPDYIYCLQDILMELASSNATQASILKPYTSIETFKYLLRVSISDRLGLLGISRWHEELENSISVLFMATTSRDRDTQAIYDRLATYESIKEGTSILELALWKYKIEESRNKRARVGGEVSYRGQCRINSGADIVIRNVLPYLMPE